MNYSSNKTQPNQKFEEKLETLVSNIPGAIYQCNFDTSWTMRFISDMIETISGYYASDFIQNNVRTYASIIHPDDRKMVEMIVQEKVKQKIPFIIEYRIIHANGKIRWVHEQGQGIFSTKEQILCLDGAIFDVTDNKLSREALRESEKRFRAIADFSNNWEYWIDPDENMGYISPACQKISGYRPEEFEQDIDLLQTIIHPEDQIDVVAQMQNWQSDFETANTDNSEIDYRIINKKGETCWVSQICQPVYDTNHEYLGYHVTIKDITKRKQMADELRQYNQRLQALSHRLVEAQEAERRHLARELHDGTGQALTSLMLRLKAIAHETELDAVLDRVAGLRVLTAQTLEDIRRLAKYLRPAALDDLGLMAALQDHVDGFRQDSGINIIFKAEVQLERLSPESEISLYRVIQEGLTNVARHAKAKNLYLSLYRVTGWLCIEIVDDGQGFDVSSVHPATKETGLGLLGMSERVELLGGDMQVKSVKGEGTQILLRVPEMGSPA
ncbi:PAS domain-containing protein [Anaerolineales bacterium HSG6]|nr:PAS domain-containing protein [Anaerolineales bacterium HSG6]